jgi:hypothetical protein
MSEHILLQKVSTYNRKKLKDPEGCEYDELIGGWIVNETNEYLVKSSDPKKPKPGTKKEDIETGEDLKGE